MGFIKTQETKTIVSYKGNERYSNKYILEITQKMMFDDFWTKGKNGPRGRV